MHTPTMMPTLQSPAPRLTSRGLGPSPVNIPVLLAPTKEFQRPGSTPTLRSRASSSIGSRPPFPVLYDPTGIQSKPPSLSPIQSVSQIQSTNPTSRSIDPSGISPISPIKNQSINPTRPSTYPSAQSSPPTHRHLPVAKQTFFRVSSVVVIRV